VVQTLLFVTGIKTLLQTLFGTRLPTIMGGSYAYVVPILSIIRDPSLAQIADGHTVSMQLSSYVFSVSQKTEVHVKMEKRLISLGHCTAENFMFVCTQS
jgi:xanthine/uracil permease